MEKLYLIGTPLGNGYVAYGEFTRGDGHKKDYHCWWNGCGIGGYSKDFMVSREYLKQYIIRLLVEEIDKSKKKICKLEDFLKTLNKENE